MVRLSGSFPNGITNHNETKLGETDSYKIDYSEIYLASNGGCI